MSKRIHQLSSAIVGGVALLSSSIALAAEPIEFVNTYDVAVIDGNPSEWDTSLSGPDFFSELYEAGNPKKDWLGNAYLRYDCASKTMFVLVLDRFDAPNHPDDVYIQKSEGDAWVKIRSINNSNIVDLDQKNNGGNATGNPPESSWVAPDGQEGSSLIGYEASFPLAPGSYDIEIHANFLNSPDSPSRTGSTGRGETLQFINIQCDPTPPPADPSIDIEKSTNGADADVETGPVLNVGDTVTWEYVVTNTGNVTLSDITVNDDQEGAITCPKTSLVPQESMTCSKTGAAVVGQYSNTATVSSSYDGEDFTDSDPSHYYVNKPDGPIKLIGILDIEKTTNDRDADEAPGPELLVGTEVTWEYTVTNIGNTAVSGIIINDDQVGDISMCQDADQNSVDLSTLDLAAGESITCYAQGTVVEGQYVNMATASGSYVDENGDTQTTDDTDSSHYFGADPSVILEKTTQGFDADEETGPYIEVGDTVFWLYSVTNDGNVDLTDIVVTDNQGVDINCGDGTNVIASLPVNETKTCLGTGIATAGQYMNVGSVDGGDYEDDDGNTDDVTDDDPSHYYGANPGIDVEKCTSGDALSECTADSDANHDEDPGAPYIEDPGALFIEGDTVYWTYTVTNTGNVTLENIVVTDSVETIDCSVASLEPGESATCTAMGVAGLGQYANEATAIGDYTVTNENGESEVRSVEDMDPSHYYGLVDNQPSLEVMVTDFTFTSDTKNAFAGTFILENASDGIDVQAIAVTNIDFTIAYRLPKGNTWVEVPTTCTTEPSVTFVFEGDGVYEGSTPAQQIVNYSCSITDPSLVPEAYTALRVTVCVNIFNRDNTFCSKLSIRPD